MVKSVKVSLMILALVLILLAVVPAFVGATPVPVGNPDTECANNVFNFGIVKYECPSGIENGSMGGSYDINVSWNACTSANWTADPAVGGVLVKAATLYEVYIGGTSGVVYGIDDVNNQGKPITHDISHITFCGNETPVVPEFGMIIGIVTILGALVAFMIIRRK